MQTVSTMTEIALPGMLATRSLQEMARQDGLPTLADLSAFVRGAPISLKGSKRNRALFDLWIAEFGAACLGCGQTMANHTDPKLRLTAPDQITRDHIVARGLGGDNSAVNQRCVCRKCNGLKSKAESAIVFTSGPTGKALSGILSGWCHWRTKTRPRGRGAGIPF